MVNQMKILFIYSNFNELGGVTTHMNNLKNILEKFGHEVIKLSFQEGGDYNIKHKFPKTHILNFSVDQKLVKKTLQVISKIKPDIIHVHHRSTCMRTAKEIFKNIQKNLRIPIIATMHGFGISGCFTAKYFKPDGTLCDGKAALFKCLSCADTLKKKLVLLKHLIINLHFGYIPYFKQFDKVIIPSKALIDFALLRGMDKNKIVYLPNFGEITVKENYEYENDRFDLPYNNFFLFVGRLCEEKGILELVEAYKFYSANTKSPIPLVIIGDGPLKNKLKDITKNNRNIIILGKLSQNKLIPYYERALGIFIPSICLENHSLVLLESIYFNKIIIATNRGGNKETLELYPKKILLDVKTREELKKKLYEVMKNFDIYREKLESIKFENRKFFTKLTSAKEYVKKLLKVYENAINEYRKE